MRLPPGLPAGHGRPLPLRHALRPRKGALVIVLLPLLLVSRPCHSCWCLLQHGLLVPLPSWSACLRSRCNLTHATVEHVPPTPACCLASLFKPGGSNCTGEPAGHTC